MSDKKFSEDPMELDFPEEIKAKIEYDLNNNPVRPLSVEERFIYMNAVSNAISSKMIPPFKDSVSLLRPYVDARCDTAYTDRYARVALSYWFFYLLNEDQQSSVILHETMHILNNHFSRFEKIDKIQGVDNGAVLNLCGDFEINSVLRKVNFVDLEKAIFPDKDPFNYPPMLTMEAYADLFKKEIEKKRKEDKQSCKGQQNRPGQQQGNQNDGDQQGSQGQQGGQNDDQQQGQGEGVSDGQRNEKNINKNKKDQNDHSEHGWKCGKSNEETEKAADEAGIQRASDSEKIIAKANTAARIAEEKKKQRSANGAMDTLFDVVLQNLTSQKIDWRKVFRQVLSQSTAEITRGRQDYTYKRTSRRHSGSEFVFPGMVSYLPKIMLAVDTSGSMGENDYLKALNEIQGVIKTVAKGKDCLNIFSVDTQIENVQKVTSIDKISLRGGGGTQMAVAWRYVSEEIKPKEKPDVLILSTDGHIDWYDVELEVRKAKFLSVILVTDEGGYNNAPESLKKKIPIICIDD